MEDETNKTCGCDCEKCTQDMHHECTTGKCEFKKRDEDQEEEM